MSNDPNNPCLFCRPEKKADWLIAENELAMLWADSNAVSEGHCLALPQRHVGDFFELTPEELLAINELLQQRRAELLQKDPTIDGFNVGINVGKAAGQSIFHVHVHLIPRRFGDHPNPQGGVRHVIHGKGHYPQPKK
ncbi:HIT family protein [Magnetofaba australis]|uniref:Putative diadenosine tetraphosphate hydrolase n=1 Tax=Magnetofaba australis IT-1 TaxID=1434232 RepID=A0A1Y2K429_9PROT|nr:HIT family protein [Magnetofaba australis]OSM04117.1 putative diadenosine tetraphosphate hydrolase [Magnetofaba australis IT-1]